jgi:hypothetical protein
METNLNDGVQLRLVDRHGHSDTYILKVLNGESVDEERKNDELLAANTKKNYSQKKTASTKVAMLLLSAKGGGARSRPVDGQSGRCYLEKRPHAFRLKFLHFK